jgi:hypothetical protein
MAGFLFLLTLVLAQWLPIHGQQQDTENSEYPGRNGLFLGPHQFPTTLNQLNDFASVFFNDNPYELLDNWKPTDPIKPQTTEQQERFISKLNQSRTVLGFSDSAYFDEFVSKLRRGECVSILTLGGSTTCGAELHWRKGERSWVWWLRYFLNLMFPCASESSESIVDQEAAVGYQPRLLQFKKPRENAGDLKRSHHTVINRCMSATGSAYVTFQFESLICDLLPRLDLVLMEFAANDFGNNELVTIHGVSSTMEESAKKYNEFIIRKLDELKIASLYIQASFRLPRRPPYFGNAEAFQLPIQQYFDIPTFSFAKLLGQEFDKFGRDGMSRFHYSRVLRDQNSHLTGIGHLMLTYVLLWNIQNDVAVHQFKGIGPVSLKPDLNLDQLDWSMLSARKSKILRFNQNIEPTPIRDPSNERCYCSKEWNIVSERRSKYGLISNSTGSFCIFRFGDLDRASAVEIGFLKSYSSMAKFRITFLMKQEHDEFRVPLSETLFIDPEMKRNATRWKSYVIDGFWGDRSSQNQYESVMIPEGTERFALEVLPNEPQFMTAFEPDPVHRGTKVKILTISYRTQMQMCTKADENPIVWEAEDAKDIDALPGDLPLDPEGVIELIDYPGAGVQNVEFKLFMDQELFLQILGMLLCAIVIVVSFFTALYRRYAVPEPESPQVSKVKQKSKRSIAL